MKVSDLKVETLQVYLKTDEEPEALKLFLDSAKSYVKDYAGLTDEQLDASDNIAICVLAVASDMYDQRQTQVTGTNYNLNKLVDSMLTMHSRNLL